MLCIRSEGLWSKREIISSCVVDWHKGSDTKQALRNYLGQTWKPPSLFSPQFSQILYCFASRLLLRSPNSPLFICIGSRCSQGKTIDLISKGLFASLGTWGLASSNCSGGLDPDKHHLALLGLCSCGNMNLNLGWGADPYNSKCSKRFGHCEK